ncbi:amidohydrolase family protein, partial [Marinobacter salarius]|uniref:amidohydrolase family protein n=1 Tax=Marinobacter salarius TaxID=1420917 RepID=UPI0032EFBB6E
TGVGLHICHLPSSAIQDTAITLELIDEARAHGVDVTTEAYPYTAGSTILISALFDAGWRERLGGVDYSDVVWTATGERLTEKTFHAYRKHAMETDDPANVIIHFVPEDAMRMAINHPDVIIASDGMTIRNNNEHPRGTGTYARVLGRFVREEGAMSMMAALRKMTILPAQRLESYAPAMRNKGRVKVGADADLTLIDPKRVIDRATYKDPMVPSDGFPYVLVNGVVVVENGTLQEGVFPGKAIKGKGLAVLAQ